MRAAGWVRVCQVVGKRATGHPEERMDRTCFSRCHESEELVGGRRSEGTEGTAQRPGRV